MLYRVIIVDDESYIADSTAMFLKSETQWEMEIEVFYSAKEALSHINNQRTDVLIADIRMPEMSGLQLMEEVRKNWPMCHIILLTAYAQFDYVYTAIQQSSVDYVLKHDGYQALRAAIERAIHQLNTNKMQQDILETANSRAKAALPWLQREFFLDLMHGVRYDDNGISRAQEQLDLPIDMHRIAYPMMMFEHEATAQQSLFERTRHMNAIELTAREFMPDGARYASVQVDASRQIWLWQFPEDRSESQLEGMLEGIQSTVLCQLNSMISFAYSAHGLLWDQYEQMYNRLSAIISMQVMGGDKLWLICADSAQISGLERLDVTRAARWISAYRVDAPSAQLELDDLLARLRDAHSVHDIGYMHLYMQIAISLAQVMHEIGLSADEQAALMPHKLYDVHAHSTPDEAANYLKWLAGQLPQLRKENAQDTMRALVSHVKNYILKHYDEDVSLNVLADFVHVNASYLSRVFKQYTGENLLEYIRGVRLNKACELLHQPGLRISEISEKLGFQTPAYFSFYFKKNMGMTPREYRDRQ